tara:strand:- start:262 stop:462 length:201 start_codon:yes stop_codon:yes gene_type:complete
MCVHVPVLYSIGITLTAHGSPAALGTTNVLAMDASIFSSNLALGALSVSSHSTLTSRVCPSSWEKK